MIKLVLACSVCSSLLEGRLKEYGPYDPEGPYVEVDPCEKCFETITLGYAKTDKNKDIPPEKATQEIAFPQRESHPPISDAQLTECEEMSDEALRVGLSAVPLDQCNDWEKTFVRSVSSAKGKMTESQRKSAIKVLNERQRRGLKGYEGLPF